jgi:ABC-type polysaccharide/polyol phosphate export permease
VEQSWDLLKVLTRRTVRARYRGSSLGIYWSLLNPLLTTFAYTAIFGHIFAKYYGGSLWLYGIEVFVGLTVANFFAGSTAQALQSVVANGELLNKMRLPPALFPLSTIGAWTFQVAAGSLPFLLVLSIALTRDPWHVLAVPLPFVALVFLCTGIGFITSTLYVFFRDVPYMYDFVTFLAWSTTPVFYPAAIVPQNIRNILEFNPLYPIVVGARQTVAAGSTLDPWLFAQALGDGALVALAGYGLFRLMRPRFMDLI